MRRQRTRRNWCADRSAAMGKERKKGEIQSQRDNNTEMGHRAGRCFPDIQAPGPSDGDNGQEAGCRPSGLGQAQQATLGWCQETKAWESGTL